MPPPSLFPLDSLDFDNPEFDLDEIRKVKPQRHEMEQLTAVLRVNQEARGLVGYKAISNDERIGMLVDMDGGTLSFFRDGVAILDAVNIASHRITRHRHRRHRRLRRQHLYRCPAKLLLRLEAGSLVFDHLIFDRLINL